MTDHDPDEPQSSTQNSKPTGTPRTSGRLVAGLGVGVIAILAIVGGVLAVQGMNQARQNQPDSLNTQTPTRDAYLARVSEAMRNSSWREAEAILREAITIYQGDQDLHLQLADVLRTRATAAAWHEQDTLPSGSGAVDPANTESARAAREAAARRQDAIDAYEQVLIALDIGPRTADVEFRAGLLASESGQPEAAIEHFQAARAADATNADYPLYLAQSQLATGEVLAAKASLLAAVNLDPDNATAWGTFAEIALRENSLDLALQHVRKARALQPDNTVWRLIEARTLKRQGHAEEALLVLTALPAPEQRDAPVLSLIAECYALLGRLGDAANRYADASDRRATDPALARQAAEWLRRAGELDRAAQYADRAAMLGDPAGAALATELRGG